MRITEIGKTGCFKSAVIKEMMQRIGFSLFRSTLYNEFEFL